MFQILSVCTLLPKKTQLFWSYLSFGEECRPVKFWPNDPGFSCIFQEASAGTYKKNLTQIFQNRLTSLTLFTRKNPEIKVVQFLLGKSVEGPHQDNTFFMYLWVYIFVRDWTEILHNLVMVLSGFSIWIYIDGFPVCNILQTNHGIDCKRFLTHFFCSSNQFQT